MVPSAECDVLRDFRNFRMLIQVDVHGFLQFSYHCGNHMVWKSLWKPTICKSDILFHVFGWISTFYHIYPYFTIDHKNFWSTSSRLPRFDPDNQYLPPSLKWLDGLSHQNTRQTQLRLSPCAGSMPCTGDCFEKKTPPPLKPPRDTRSPRRPRTILLALGRSV